MSMFFSRDTRVLLKQGANMWEIPVLDGFSFSQASNSSEITLSESVDATGRSRRSRQMFNDSLAPAEWSLSTYMRPIKCVPGSGDVWMDSGSDANCHAVEEALWANFIANNAWTASNGATEGTWADGVVNTSGTLALYEFTGSDVPELGTFELFFVMGKSGSEQVYKIAGACVNEANIEFELDGIATINWSGFGSLISDEGSSVPTATNTISEQITSTSNFIRNRLTTLTMQATDTTAFAGDGDNDGTYNITLTGGSLTFSNNITFLTPEDLGKVNVPLGHVAGTRTIGGSFTCYLNDAVGGSADLFQDLMLATTTTVNEFDLIFAVGGDDLPHVDVTMPRCHLEIPQHSIDDAISLDVTFHSLPLSIAPGASVNNYEAKLQYVSSS